MLNRKTGLIALLISFAATEIWAATLTNYAVGDVLICFRKSSSGNDMVVDAGPIAAFTNASVNQRIPITQFTSSQLGLLGTNAVNWSAFTWSDDTVLPVSSQGTLFMTKARSNPNIQNTSGWSASSAASQFVVINSDLQTIPPGANVNLAFKTQNIPTAIVEPDDPNNSNPDYTDGQSYAGALGPNLDFNGDFGRNPEKTTAANFTAAGVVVRSDFYQLPPTDSGNPVKYLGLFEFNTNGAMTYVAYATPPAVSTVAATSVTGAGAQLNSMVNPNADNTTFYFQYGLSTSYDSTSVSNNVGTASGSYSLGIQNLIASTTYHYRVAAYNEYGTNFGGDLTFTTTSGSSAPAVPVITYFSRSNNLTTIAYTTGNSGTYTLRGTNNLANAGAQTNWPAIASVAGDGLIHTNTDPDVTGAKFYVITAQ
jgi:hypothetical protein